MRKFGVSKTIKRKVANVMFVDTDTGEVFEQEILIKRLDDDLEKLCLRIAKNHNTTTKRVVKVLGVTESNVRYGMTVEDFIKHATVLSDSDVIEVSDETTIE